MRRNCLAHRISITAFLLVGVARVLARAEETDIGVMLDPRMINHVGISADCQNVVIVRSDGNLNTPGRIVLLNGAVQDRGFIPSVTISPDGKRLAWVRTFPRQGSALFTGLNEYVQYDGLIESAEGLKFSPDSKHLVFGARRGSDWFAVLDGVEGPAGDGPPALFRFSADSRRMAYVLANEGKKQVVVDGHKGEQYLDIRDLNFNVDGVHLSYAASIATDQWVAVVDGVIKSAPFSSINGLTVNCDGGHWGFSAHRGKESPPDDQYAIVVDGVATSSFNQYFFGPAFSEDGKHVFFVVTRATGGQVRATPTFDFVSSFDGKTQEGFHFLQEAIYSPDGEKLALVICRNVSPMQLPAYLYAVTLDGRELFGGDRAGENGYFGRLMFSPDGAHLAFAARIWTPGERDDYRWSVCIDGKRGQQFRSVGPAVFSPDSKHIAYAAQKGNTWIMVLDGKELPYELLRPTVDGGPDGRWNTVPVPEIKATFSIPWDGPRREDFEVPQIPYRFDKNGKLNFIGVRDGRIYRVSMDGG